MKAKVIKEIEPSGDCYFMVSLDGKHIKAFSYNPDSKPNEITGEQTIYKKAFALAKRLEGSDGNTIREVIYETPETI